MILVLAEQRQGTLARATWEAVAAAQTLAAGDTIAILVLGSAVGTIAADLAAAAAVGVQEILTIEHPTLAAYTPDAYTAAVAQALAETTPSLVLLPHTYQARDWAPKLAARLGRALVTDGTAVRRVDGEVRVVRPMFQGKLAAEVALLGPAPHVVTLQIGAYRADQVKTGGSAPPVRALAITLDAAAVREQPEPPFQQARQAVDLTQAERLVAVGRGIKAQEHIQLAQQLADALGAELAASRPICDAGWLPMERQVGSSGQTVAPKLYVALGISGAIQHVVGMKGARTIVAINKDAEAPIFEIADYGIVGDLFEVVPALIAALQKT